LTTGAIKLRLLIIAGFCTGKFDVGAAGRYHQSLLDAATDSLDIASAASEATEPQPADESKPCSVDGTCFLCLGFLQQWDSENRISLTIRLPLPSYLVKSLKHIMPFFGISK
jgi:hypothetical protein